MKKLVAGGAKTDPEGRESTASKPTGSRLFSAGALRFSISFGICLVLP